VQRDRAVKDFSVIRHWTHPNVLLSSNELTLSDAGLNNYGEQLRKALILKPLQGRNWPKKAVLPRAEDKDRCSHRGTNHFRVRDWRHGKESCKPRGIFQSSHRARRINCEVKTTRPWLNEEWRRDLCPPPRRRQLNQNVFEITTLRRYSTSKKGKRRLAYAKKIGDQLSTNPIRLQLGPVGRR